MSRSPLALALALLGVVSWLPTTGCRSAEVTRLQGYQGPPVQQPRRIYVYDFGTDDARMQLADADEDPARVAAETARALSLALVRELEDFHIPVERRVGPLEVPEDSVALDGELVRVDEGSRARRVLIGFGSGASHVDTLARVYLPGARGPEKMAEYRTTSTSGRKPGILTTLPIGALVQGFTGLVLLVNAGSATLGELNASVAGNAEETASEWAEQLQQLFHRNGWLDEDPDEVDFMQD